MTGSLQTTLRRITKLLVKLIRQAWAFNQRVILPLVDFCWRSLLDLNILVNTSENRDQLRRWTMTSLMRAERRLETVLPASFKHNWPLKTIGLLLLLLLLFVLLPKGDSSVDDLKEAGELVVISRESPTTLYLGDEGPAGPEYDYLKSFAEFLGVDLRFEMRDNDQQVLSAISDDEGHVAAAGMTFYPPLEDEGFIFGPGYQEVDIEVVCRRNGARPRNIEELSDLELVVVADSTYEARLIELQEEFTDLTWESAEDTNVDNLLQLVWRKEIDCTIANSSEVNIKRRFYPELEVAFTLEENQTLAWNLSPRWEALSDSIGQWLSAIENDGTLLVLQDRHYNTGEFDYVDMRTFIRRMKSRLPLLTPLFEKAAEKYDIPWTLLAAQAYQESHWDRRARSRTGVRGIMMLTLETAKEMGVKSRLNVVQSIMGGAKYLSRLEGRIPENVKGDDRWWYALAAYNVGLGHLRDALALAGDLDLNPDSWLDLKGVLPLLSQKKYYKGSKYGYARGTEPVTYVRQVRNYQNILRAQIISKQGFHGG
jgi:membrane-bound lytic murein transglycosylase F